jgi:hypothetical protein
MYLYVFDQDTPEREAKGPSWTISACEWTNSLRVSTHQSTRRYNADEHLHSHSRERLKCHTVYDAFSPLSYNVISTAEMHAVLTESDDNLKWVTSVVGERYWWCTLSQRRHPNIMNWEKSQQISCRNRLSPARNRSGHFLRVKWRCHTTPKHRMHWAFKNLKQCGKCIT